jgi:hypothetical protein
MHAVHVSGCRATYGGAIWAESAVSLGAGTRLQLCTAFRGGGVFVQGPSGSLAATWATVEGCRATHAGGGVYATLNASVRLERVALRGNAAGANGGGVYIVDGGELAMSGDTSVQDNTVSNASVLHRGAGCIRGRVVLRERHIYARLNFSP